MNLTQLTEIKLTAQPVERFVRIIGEEQIGKALEIAAALRKQLAGRVLWNVNSTAVGGGVAEMLNSLLRYSRGLGVDARWLVIRGNPEFFRVTKRLHHALHGSTGDGSILDGRARTIYEETLRGNALELCGQVRPGDLVLLHDPQTAGLAPHLNRSGAHVLWRCHIGHDSTNGEVEHGWEFLRPYLEHVRALIFTRAAYVPDYCDHGKSTIIQPSIDAFSAKNAELDEATLRTILVHVGLVEGPLPNPACYVFEGEDGRPRRIERRADVIRLGRAPAWETPLVVQVSRWDTLKDPIGVMRGFALLVDRTAPANAELVLAGPNVHDVSDDPEGASVFTQVLAEWRALPQMVRNRIHLASIPTADVDENAVIVNALQRHAAVVVQKSLHEGFGLTVTEAMWKGRPVLASAEDGVHGILLKDPMDLQAFATALRRLLEDPAYARRLGNAARQRVRTQFLGVRHLLEYASVLQQLDI
jgi:trehalose synthase